MIDTPRLVIAAPGRSSGKTTIAMGLCRAFKERGLSVQPFKKGPDYIDPMWLTSAAGVECRNLDFHMMGDENILRAFQTASKGADIAIIEGNMGLHDGMDIEGSDSTAGLAHFLRAPVILVIDATGMNRSVAAVLLGYRQLDPELDIAGVILNRVSGPRHESKIRSSIERHVGLDVLGVIPKAPDDVGLIERHLGLIPVKEDPSLASKIAVIGEMVEKCLDLDVIYSIAKTAGDLPNVKPCPTAKGDSDIKIGVAMDRAFTFYYQENLEALESAGAELIPFSPLEDSRLPDVNGLYIGGGFPEMFLSELESNKQLRNQIKDEIENGLPVYAECGGLMYLAKSISWDGKSGNMVNAFDFSVEMTKKPVALGYATLEASGKSEWFNPKGKVYCHEFHHSHTVGVEDDTGFAWNVIRGTGVQNKMDGAIYKNVLASYAHLHSCGASTWAIDFADFIRKTGKLVGVSENSATIKV
jgi:cobyrinic acid a,c-diamide synthase